MAISTQISRLMSLRDAIRTKMIGLGILPAASSSATLSQCYDALSGVTALGAMSYTPTTAAQTIPSGRYLSGVQTIEAIPSAYIIPTGTITLSSSGTFDVGSYASADVTATGGPSGPYVERVSASTYIAYNHTTFVDDEFAIEYGNSCNVILDSSISQITGIGNRAFQNFYGTVSGGDKLFNATGEIGENAFANARIVNILSGPTIEFPNITKIGSRAFMGAVLKPENGVVSFAQCSFIGEGAFCLGDVPWSEQGSTAYVYLDYNCPSIYHNNAVGTIVSLYYFPSCLTIGSFAFYSPTYYYNNQWYAKGSSTTAYSFPECTTISAFAFANNRNIKDANFPKVELLSGWRIFCGCPYLSSISFPNLKQIYNGSRLFTAGDGVFSARKSTCFTYTQGRTGNSAPSLSELYFPELISCTAPSMAHNNSNIKSVNMPKVKVLNGAGMFSSCSNLSYISFPSVETIIGTAPFNYCSKITELIFPELKIVSCGYSTGATTASKYGTFYNVSNVSVLSMPKLEKIDVGEYVFASKQLLTFMSFPKLSYIGPGANYTFFTCSNVSQISLPLLEKIDAEDVFRGCYALESIYLPNWTGNSVATRNSSIFQNCRELSIASFPRLSRISGPCAFSGCYNLISLFLTGFSVCALGNTIASMFGSTPVSTYSTSAGRFASIFVPSSLLADYKAATNWTTISSKFFAYEDYFDSNGNPLT